MSNSTVRMLMYIIGIVIGVILVIVGATSDGSQRDWMIGLGAGIVLASLYAWYRGLGPTGRDTPDSPGPSTGTRFEMQDTIAIAVILIVCVVGGVLIF